VSIFLRVLTGFFLFFALFRNSRKLRRPWRFLTPWPRQSEQEPRRHKRSEPARPAFIQESSLDGGSKDTRDLERLFQNGAATFVMSVNWFPARSGRPGHRTRFDRREQSRSGKWIDE
jgi:hypothetical protein